MLEKIKTFLQSICEFLNRKGILKKCYRCCAILTVGTTVVAVASFCSREFGGKNNVAADALSAETGDGGGETEDEAQDGAIRQEAVDAEIELAVRLQELYSADILQREDQSGSLVNAAAAALIARTRIVTPEEVRPKEAELESRAVETVAQVNDHEAVSVSAEEYEILTRIVEAEAGTEDVKGKMLIANVVLNRVAYAEFPDNIKDVVFQKKGKRYQFSPLKDGRYYDVEVQESTRIAVDRVLAGEDESMGALFFCERDRSSSSNLKWFDSQLERIFTYGCHEFFVYK